jgi:hypothetical protein
VRWITLDEHLKFPAWQEPLRDLLLEGDPDKLSQKVAEVERLISDRRQQLWKDGNGVVERNALDDAVRFLRTIKRNSGRFTDDK